MQAVQHLPRLKPSFSNALGHVDLEKHDRKLQNEAIAQLSAETGWPVENVGPLYRWIFRELEQEAQVRDYLFVLTAKQIRRILSKRKLPKQFG